MGTRYSNLGHHGIGLSPSIISTLTSLDLHSYSCGCLPGNAILFLIHLKHRFLLLHVVLYFKSWRVFTGEFAVEGDNVCVCVCVCAGLARRWPCCDYSLTCKGIYIRSQNIRSWVKQVLSIHTLCIYCSIVLVLFVAMLITYIAKV